MRSSRFFTSRSTRSCDVQTSVAADHTDLEDGPVLVADVDRWPGAAVLWPPHDLGAICPMVEMV